MSVADVPITARSGTARLHGKGDEVRTVPLLPARERLASWLLARAELLTARPALAEAIGDGLWAGQRGRLSVEGVTDGVRAVGKAVSLPGLRPHRLRHTYATRLREAGADHAQIQALLGHAFATLALDAGTTLRDVQDAMGHADPRTNRSYGYQIDRPLSASCLASPELNRNM